MSYGPVAEGEIAAVVTFLEMVTPPSGSVPVSLLELEPIRPSPNEYRTLFRRVGSRWLWFSRLVMADDQLAAIIQDPKVELSAIVDHEDRLIGMLELDFREAGQCEIAFIGLVPEFAGQGHGRWLLAEVLRRAWRDGVSRVHVHTCTLDHPAALSAYLRAGFTAYKREIERFPDPRLAGILPLDCAPQLPLVGTLASAAPAPDA